MTDKIKELIETMTPEEIKQRLAAYMTADLQFSPRPVAIKVRASIAAHSRSRYEVVLVSQNGDETEVKFYDSYSRLVYIYTLCYRQGYQRRQAAANSYKALRQLYTLLYFKKDDALLKTIDSTGFDHFYSHYIAQSRKAIREATPHAADYAIDRPQSHDGKVLIPFVAQGGAIDLPTAIRNLFINLLK